MDGRKKTSEIKPDSVSVWAQLHDLPLLCMSNSMVEKLGPRIREVICVDDQIVYGVGIFYRT